MAVETEGGRGGRSREVPPLTSLQLLRNLVPVASATIRDTPESPVPSGDRCLETLNVELLKSLTSKCGVRYAAKQIVRTSSQEMDLFLWYVGIPRGQKPLRAPDQRHVMTKAKNM